MVPLNVEWLRQAEEFNQIWKNRHQPPLVTSSWVHNEWAKGRTSYLTFLISLGDRRLVDTIRRIQIRLSDYSCIDVFPQSYLHITVKELDAFLVSAKHFPDEYTEEDLPPLIEAAREKLSRFERFELRLENLNNFKSTVCIEAHDGGAIRNMNRALLQIPGVRRLRNDHPRFLPHVSVAQYRSTEDYERLIEHLEQNRETKVGSLKVDSVKLVIVRLPVSGRFPRFRMLEELRLE